MKSETQLIYILDTLYGDDLNPPVHKVRSPKHAWRILRSLLPWLAYVALLAVLPLTVEKYFGSQGLLYYVLCLFVLGFAALGLAVRRRR